MAPSASDHIVLFYLTDETSYEGGMFCKAQNLKHCYVDALDEQGGQVRYGAVKVVIPRDVSPKEPTLLLTFGSNPQCDIILEGPGVSTMHCKMYIQLNEGLEILVLEDASEFGTQFLDTAHKPDETGTTVHKTRDVVDGLIVLQIGAFFFGRFMEIANQEAQSRNDWFRAHQRRLTTQKMLQRQLAGRPASWKDTRIIGNGTFGVVQKCNERNTGLSIAVKKQRVRLDDAHHNDAIRTEIEIMKKTTKHVRKPRRLLADWL